MTTQEPQACPRCGCDLDSFGWHEAHGPYATSWTCPLDMVRRDAFVLALAERLANASDVLTMLAEKKEKRNA